MSLPPPIDRLHPELKQLVCHSGDKYHTFSHLQCFFLTGEESLRWAVSSCVGYKQRRIIFYSGCRCSTLVYWLGCESVSITLFPSRCLPMVRASWSTLSYCEMIRLPSFPVSTTALKATIWGDKKGLVFLRVCTCAYMIGGLCGCNMPFIHKEMLQISTGSWCNRDYHWCERRLVFCCLSIYFHI